MADDLFQSLKIALAFPGLESSDFDLNPDVKPSSDCILRPAGVLIAIIRESDDWRVILTKRSSALKHHPGQIAFAGGKQDETDANVTDAALREAGEEIGLNRKNVDIFGILACHETVTGFKVTPVIGLVRDPFTARPEPGEVDEVFSVPLAHLININNYRIQSRQWQGRLRRYYVVPYGPYYIWGATARILRGLAERMNH